MMKMTYAALAMLVQLVMAGDISECPLAQKYLRTNNILQMGTKLDCSKILISSEPRVIPLQSQHSNGFDGTLNYTVKFQILNANCETRLHSVETNCTLGTGYEFHEDTFRNNTAICLVALYGNRTDKSTDACGWMMKLNRTNT